MKTGMPFVAPAQVGEGGDAVEPLEKGARSRQHPQAETDVLQHGTTGVFRQRLQPVRLA